MLDIGRQLSGGGAATLQKQDLNLSQSVAENKAKLADGNGGGNNGKNINNGGGGDGGDDGDDDDYFDDDEEVGFFCKSKPVSNRYIAQRISASTGNGSLWLCVQTPSARHGTGFFPVAWEKPNERVHKTLCRTRMNLRFFST
jgi:hypothetical protein